MKKFVPLLFLLLFCMHTFIANADDHFLTVTEIIHKGEKVNLVTGGYTFAPGAKDPIKDQNIKLGDKFPVGWVIVAPSLTKIILKSPKGNEVTMHPGAKLAINRITDKGESYGAREGGFYFKVRKAMDFFNVEHDRFVAIVRGTEYGVDVDLKGSTISYQVMAGVVEIEREGKVKIEEDNREIIGIKVADKIKAGDTRIYRLDFNEYLTEYKTFQDAEEYFRKGLKDAEKGGDDDALMRALYNLGCILQNVGKDRDSMEYFERGLDIARRIKNQSWKACFINNLGNSYHGLGKYEKAIEYFEKSLAMKQRLYKGGDHPDIAASYNNLGFSCDGLGKYEKAIEYHEKSLAMKQRLYKDADHPDIAKNYNNLGLSYGGLGNYERAFEYFEKSLAMNQRLYKDADHPDIAASYNNLALSYGGLGNYEKAIEYFEKSLAMNQRLYKGADHPGIVKNYNNLGLSYYGLGQYERAIEYYEKSLAMNQRLYKSADHPDIVMSYNNLALAYEKLGNLVGAEKFSKSAREMKERLKTK